MQPCREGDVTGHSYGAVEAIVVGYELAVNPELAAVVASQCKAVEVVRLDRQEES